VLKDIRNLLEIGLIERQEGKFSRIYKIRGGKPHRKSRPHFNQS